MFREIWKKDREIVRNEAIEILINGTYGILSTIGQNGYPYGVPVNYVYLNNAVYFHCAMAGHKLDNIINNAKVSFCVVGQTAILAEKFSTKYESAIIFGRAMEVFDEEKSAALHEMLDKYSPDHKEKGKDHIQNACGITKVIKICIEHISGKARR